MSAKIKIAIFASGTGTNAQKIIEHFSKNNFIGVALIVSNKKDAGVLNVAAQNNIPTLIIEKDLFFDTNTYISLLQKLEIDFIVLAGFLWKIPQNLIAAYPNKIINIHPALLPKYGGKGMYGTKVHEAVILNKEKESGITIHYVDEQYDHGKIIFQASCSVDENDTPESLAQKIHQLEHQYFPTIIEECIAAV